MTLCCSLECRAKVVAIYNIAAGGLGVMIAVTARTTASEDIILYFVVNCLTIFAGILLLVGMDRESWTVITVWLAVQILLTTAHTFGICHVVYTSTEPLVRDEDQVSNSRVVYGILITSLIIHLLILAACIVTIFQFRAERFPRAGHVETSSPAVDLDSPFVAVEDNDEAAKEIDTP